MVGSNTRTTTERVNVLLVDDEPFQTELAKLNLEVSDPSLSIDLVYTARDALAMLRKHPYDCVVSDYKMSGMNGIQLISEIRRFSNLSFILYSGRGSDEIASAALAAGADDYVEKESNLTHYRVLAKKIRQAVHKKLVKFM